MTYLKCIGCNKDFVSARAYGAHSHYCKNKVGLRVKKHLARRKVLREREAAAASQAQEVEDLRGPAIVRVYHLDKLPRFVF
jgi:hypothetical protein